MSNYVRRFSKAPQPVTAQSHRRALVTAAAAASTSLAMASQSQADAADAPTSPEQVEIASQPVWNYPPAQWENVDQLGYALLPAIGATAVIVSFTVPIGRNGIINKIGNNFVGGGWVEGTGDVLWRVLVDGVPPPGATSYFTIAGSLGSPAAPTIIAGFRIFENQVISLVAFNNPAGPSGGVVVAGQRVGGRLLGYLYPREYEIDQLWI
jgi:hypothetical protein